MNKKELNKLRKTTIEKLEELKNNLSYDMEEDYSNMINIMIDYDNEAYDDLYLYDSSRDILDVIDNEILDYLIKDTNCQRLFYLTKGIEYSDNIYKINAYGNLENVTSDDVKLCIDMTIEKLEEIKEEM